MRHSTEHTSHSLSLAGLRDGFKQTINRSVALTSDLKDRLSTPTALRNLGFGIAIGSQTLFRMIEGWVVRYPGDFLRSLEYTAINIPNNPIWSTVSVETWEQMMHGSNEALLSIVNNYAVGGAGAIGGALLLTWVLNLVNAPGEKAKHIETDYFNGNLPVKPKGPQTFAIGGRSSNALDQLCMDKPEQITPIFENVQGGRLVAERLSMKKLRKGKGSFISLNVDESEQGPRTYGNADSSWEKLIVSEENLIHTPDERRILHVTGFGERSEEELTRSSKDSDVTQDELHTSTQKIIERFKACGVDMTNVEVVKTYLGSAQVKRHNRDTQRLTDTDRSVAKAGGISLYVDTWSGIISGIAKKLENASIRLSTRVPEYRKLFNAVAKSLGKTLITKENDNENATILIYEQITDNALNSLKQLMEEMPGRQLFALISSLSGKEMATSQKLERNIISTADILSKLVDNIAADLQKGLTVEVIQEKLDSDISVKVNHK